METDGVETDGVETDGVEARLGTEEQGQARRLRQGQGVMEAASGAEAAPLPGPEQR